MEEINKIRKYFFLNSNFTQDRGYSVINMNTHIIIIIDYELCKIKTTNEAIKTQKKNNFFFVLIDNLLIINNMRSHCVEQT